MKEEKNINSAKERTEKGKRNEKHARQSSLENGDRSPDFMPSPIISASGDLS
jgi:hypothetical protein